MPDILKLSDSERVDRPDLEYLANAEFSGLRQFGGNFVTNPAGGRAVIFGGFKPEVQGAASAKQLLIRRGTAVLSMREAGTALHGIFAAEGDDTKVLDLSAYSVAVHAIFLRFELVDGDLANRVFWDPVGLSEVAQNVATRRVASWGMQAVPYTDFPNLPGVTGEWFYVGDVDVQAGLIVVTPKRALMFEGYEGDSFALAWADPSSGDSRGWGDGANDRNANRDLYGVKDLNTFAMAALRKVEEISSATARWWEVPPEPLDQKVSRNGDNTMSGNYVFNGSGHSITSAGPVIVNGLLNANAGLRTATPQTVGTHAAPFSQGYFQSLVEANGGTSTSALVTTGTYAQLLLENTGTPATFGSLSMITVVSPIMIMTSSHPISLAPSGTDGLANPAMVLDATHVYPGTNNAVDLGKTATRWNNSYFHHGFVNGALTLEATGTLVTNSAARVVGHLIPSAADTYDLGASSGGGRWDQVYVKSVAQIESIVAKASHDLLLVIDPTLTINGGSVVLQPTGVQRGLIIQQNALDPTQGPFVYFSGSETSTLPGGGTDPPATIYNPGTSASKFVAVHVKDGGSYQTLWLECRSNADLPA